VESSLWHLVLIIDTMILKPRSVKFLNILGKM
jgi:hypothetical protein